MRERDSGGGHQPRRVGPGRGGRHLLCQEDPHRGLGTVDAAHGPQPGMGSNARGQGGIRRQHRVRGHGVRVEVEQPATAGHRRGQVPQVLETDLGGHVIAARGERDDRGTRDGAAGWDRDGRDSRDNRGRDGKHRDRRPGDRHHAPAERTGFLYVSLGRKGGVRPGDLVGAIANESGLSGSEIGPIRISDHYSVVGVPADAVDRVIGQMRGAGIRGKQVKVRRFTT